MSDVPLPADWFESHVMDAADPLWQWRVHSDRVVLSPEAASLLEGGTAGSYRGGSAAFCAGLAAGRQEGVRQLFGTLRRSSGSALEILQAVGGDIICCRAIVLERFPCGTPRLLVGALTRLDGRGRWYQPGAEGRWIYDRAREEYTLDRNCARLLHLPDSGALRLSRQAIRDMMGPETVRVLSTRFSRLLSARDHDGSFVERVLLTLPDGSRKDFLACGTLVGHDGSGTPVYVTGNLVPRGGEEGQEALSSKNCEISLMALFGSGDGLWDWNMETNTIYYSPRYIAMLGYDQRRFGHTFESWRDKLHPDERPAVLKRQMDIIMSPRYGDSYEQSFRMLKADGTYCWILSRARVLRRNAHGRATRLIGLHTDITATQGERDRLAEMIEYDSLTDVHSLVYFHNELDRLDRQPDREVSVISCDVNGLKLINDYLGTTPATACCRRPPACCGARCVPRTAWPAWAATSSPCCCPGATCATPRGSWRRSGKFSGITTNIPAMCRSSCPLAFPVRKRRPPCGRPWPWPTAGCSTKSTAAGWFPAMPSRPG